MILIVNGKNYNLNPISERLANFKKIMGGMNLTILINEALSDPNPELIAAGLSALGNMNIEDAYKLMDEYIEQGDDYSYATLIAVIYETVDEVGFFGKKKMLAGVANMVAEEVKKISLEKIKKPKVENPKPKGTTKIQNAL